VEHFSRKNRKTPAINSSSRGELFASRGELIAVTLDGKPMNSTSPDSFLAWGKYASLAADRTECRDTTKLNFRWRVSSPQPPIPSP
jgi:hypothetical protein